MLAPVIYEFLKGKRYAIGETSERKDGTWKKIGPKAKDWARLKQKKTSQSKKTKKRKGKRSSTAQEQGDFSSHYDWLKKNTTLKKYGGWTEMNFPLLDRHNDHIQILVKKQKNGFSLSDNGMTESDFSFDKLSKQRKDAIDIVLKDFALQRTDSDIKAYVSSKNFELGKHNFLRGLQAINGILSITSAEN